MITLQNKLYESLLDDEDNLIDDKIVLIEQFLKDNYEINGSYTIKNGIVDINGSIQLSDKGRLELTELTNDMFEFGVVSGNFACSDCINLKDLTGAPKEIEEDFTCNNCINLQSLKGGSEKVGRFFNCSGCDNLKDLTGAPWEVGGFDCTDCSSLTSLEEMPELIKGDFTGYRCYNLKRGSRDIANQRTKGRVSM